MDFLINKWKEFSDNDDVFAQEFTTGGLLLLQTDPHRVDIGPAIADVQSYLEERSSTLVLPSTLVLQGDTIDEALPEGPYIVVGNQLHQTWRLYEDSLEAFVSSTVPALEQQYGYIKTSPNKIFTQGTLMLTASNPFMQQLTLDFTQSSLFHLGCIIREQQRNL